MCYLVAKDRNAHGCFALKTTHGKHLVELKRELNKEVGYKGVQLVTISRPTAYGEYAPLPLCGYRTGISDSCEGPSSIKMLYVGAVYFSSGDWCVLE